MNDELTRPPATRPPRRRLAPAAAAAAGLLMTAAGPLAGGLGVATTVRVAVRPGSVTVTLRVGGGPDGAFVFELTRFWATRRPDEDPPDPGDVGRAAPAAGRRAPSDESAGVRKGTSLE